METTNDTDEPEDAEAAAAQELDFERQASATVGQVLDLVGDLALLGCPLLGHVTAFQAGNTQHLGFMEAIADAPHCW